MARNFSHFASRSVQSHKVGIQRIVVIDGEPVVRQVVSAILTHAGYVVSATSDVTAAIEECSISLPSLVVTNVMLPGITGHDAMRLLRQRFPMLPVLMVSGLPSRPEIQHWINEDGFDVFPKPFTAEMLIQ